MIIIGGSQACTEIAVHERSPKGHLHTETPSGVSFGKCLGLSLRDPVRTTLVRVLWDLGGRDVIGISLGAACVVWVPTRTFRVGCP